jgi:formylglycine-generating enzyme required for sulfatase activity
MKPAATTHPTPEQLAAYSQGRLSNADHAGVEAHVTGCDSCCRRLDELPADSLAGLVRGANQGPHAETTTGQQSAPSTVTPKVPPELVDHPRYRVLGLLGVGGMGAVFKAEHKMMERTVALKVINRRLVESEQALERFRREVKTAAKLSHPNIVAAHDADQAGDVHFLVMEYVQGQSLAQVVERRGPLPVIYACSYIRAAALGLQHAHEQGMVHRDLKPQNLMLTPKGQIKVLDFGLARFASETTQAAALTQENAVVGTPDYIAPEQATDARQADIRADIYSLGCTLYFLLTGGPPFPEGTVMQKVLSHIEKQPKSVTTFRTDLPEGLMQVLDRMLAKDPAQRFQKPAEVAQALLPFTKPGAKPAAAAPAAAPAAESPSTTLAFDTEPALPRRKPAARPAKNRWPLIAGLAAAAIVGVSLLAWAVLRVQTPNGTLVIKTNDPDVQVLVKQDGKQVQIVDTKSGQEVELQAGTYELELKGGKPGLKLSTDRFTLSRGDQKIVEVTLERSVAQTTLPTTRQQAPPTGQVPPPTKPATAVPVQPPDRPIIPPEPKPFTKLPGKEYHTNSLGMHFVKIPKGSFWMGGSSGKPGKQQVAIEEEYYLGIFEVTQEQWQTVMGSNPSYYSRTGNGKGAVKPIADPDLAQFPVESVSWEDVQDFVKRLNEREQGGMWSYRLPTDAEWEYACRGAVTSQEESAFDFYFDQPTNDLSFFHANFSANFPAGQATVGPRLGRPIKVGSYRPNQIGLYDMHGNVWEWCENPTEGRPGRVVRGGSWFNRGYECRAANRGSFALERRDYSAGFRLARVHAGKSAKIQTIPAPDLVRLEGKEYYTNSIGMHLVKVPKAGLST